MAADLYEINQYESYENNNVWHLASIIMASMAK
jgi:hypothetical protein